MKTRVLWAGGIVAAVLAAVPLWMLLSNDSVRQVGAVVAEPLSEKAIPDETGLIHSCVVTETGAVTIVENESQCEKNELHVWWNQSGTGDTAGAPAGPAPPSQPSPPDCQENSANVLYNGVCYHFWYVYELAVGHAPPFGRGALLEDLLVTSVGPSTITASLSPPPNPMAPNDVEIELGTLSAPALESRITVLGTVLEMRDPDGLRPGLAARLQGRRLDLLSGP